MGWQNIKEHYQIKHIVHVRDGNILIGSPLCSDLFTIDPAGKFLKKWDTRPGDVLHGYMTAISADPAKFSELFASPDTFAASLPVFTYDGGDVIEKQCEVRGWPNVTHDGELMYDNTFFADKADAISRAKENAKAGISASRSSVEDAEERLAKCRAWLHEAESNLAKLNADYPDAQP